MNIEDTQEIILSYLEINHPFLNHRRNRTLICENNRYQIRPDDAFYYEDSILLVEYEKNKRPVESISKYYWLFENTNWLEEALKINLLLTINRENINAIRTEAIQILGNELNSKNPLKFNFRFINYNDINEEALIIALQELTANN